MTADVCLILEGTYPYVTGGVSAWIHQLVSALPELRFTLFHISATAGETLTPRYALPPNVVSLVNLGLHGGDERPVAGERLGDDAWRSVADFHDQMRDGQEARFGDVLAAFCPAPGRGPSTHDLLYGEPAWEVVRGLYEARAPDVSFLDYFWTCRFTHLPIFRLLHAAVPEAALYHTVSTGWAGLAATLARARTGRPMLLTEHGIYARERRMEIDQADWIYVQRQLPMTLRLEPGFFKELWSRLFYRLSRLTYAHADLIITIFEGNRLAQIEDGADPARTLVVPNGIDEARFANLRRVAPAEREFRVGFVGRVVLIKDVKTFLRAFRIVLDAVPGARALIAGPLDEDSEYVAECQALAVGLGLQECLRFTGPLDVREVYALVDVVVLTSVSEGVPLVILEAGAAGLPVVASDVGACRELLQGRDDEDRSLGASGLVTGIGDPAGTARALVTLARDSGLREEMGRTGRARVAAHYGEAALVRSYREIYTRFLARP